MTEAFVYDGIQESNFLDNLPEQDIMEFINNLKPDLNRLDKEFFEFMGIVNLIIEKYSLTVAQASYYLLNHFIINNWYQNNILLQPIW